MIICVVGMVRACLSVCIPTVTGVPAAMLNLDAKVRLVMLMGSALSILVAIYVSENTFIYLSATNVNIV